MSTFAFGSIFAITTSLLARTAHALDPSIDTQTFGLPPNDTNTYVSADTHPNASSTVAFGFPGVSPQNWTWTVNVTDVAVPGSDSHVAYTTYSFSWPYGGSLNQALATERNTSGNENSVADSRIFLLLHPAFPQNVSDAWNSSQGSSCMDALGQQCVNALLSSTSSGGLGGNGAKQACQGSLWRGDENSFGSESIPFGNASNSTALTGAVQKNATWSYALTAPYPASNSSAFEAEAIALHVIALQNFQTTVLLCNRAGARSSNTSPNSTATPSPHSAADPSARISVIMAFVGVGIAAFAWA